LLSTAAASSSLTFLKSAPEHNQLEIEGAASYSNHLTIVKSADNRSAPVEDVEGIYIGLI
jgi:hypothetical protein